MKLIPVNPCFICINTIVITNTVICTFNVRHFNLAHLRVVKKCLNDAVLFLHGNTHETYKSCVAANLDG